MLPLSIVAQDKIALKTNLLYTGISLTPNIAAEVGLDEHSSVSLSASYNWFNLNGKSTSNKMMVHWLIQPEWRYYIDKRFYGHYLGAHAIGTMYNISNKKKKLLFGKDSKNHRYEGGGYGLGASYGYIHKIADKWNVELKLGLGYVRMKYDKYRCVKCGEKIQQNITKNYFGPTQAGISLIYVLH
jgi:hypothetical protein